VSAARQLERRRRREHARLDRWAACLIIGGCLGLAGVLLAWPT